MKIVTFEQLKTATQYTRPADVERCLTEQGIRVFYGKDGPWTTIDIINARGGIKPNSDVSYDPSLVAS